MRPGQVFGDVVTVAVATLRGGDPVQRFAVEHVQRAAVTPGDAARETGVRGEKQKVVFRIVAHVQRDVVVLRSVFGSGRIVVSARLVILGRKINLPGDRLRAVEIVVVAVVAVDEKFFPPALRKVGRGVGVFIVARPLAAVVGSCAYAHASFFREIAVCPAGPVTLSVPTVGPFVQVGSVAALDADVDALFGFAAGYEVHDRAFFPVRVVLDFFLFDQLFVYLDIDHVAGFEVLQRRFGIFPEQRPAVDVGAFDDFPHHGDLSVFDFHAGHPQHQLHTLVAGQHSYRFGVVNQRVAALPHQWAFALYDGRFELVIGRSERHRIHPRAFRPDPYPARKIPVADV